MKRKNYGKLGRTVAILVALLMVVSLAIPAFAQEQKSSDNQVVSKKEKKGEITTDDIRKVLDKKYKAKGSN